MVRFPSGLAGRTVVVNGPEGALGTDRFLRILRRGGALFPIFPLGYAGAEEAAVPPLLSRNC